MTLRSFLRLAGVAGLLFLSAPAHAQPETTASAGNGGIVPAVTYERDRYSAGDAPTLRLTPDKSELVRLDGNAASVVVGNAAHVSVLAESPNLLVVVPKTPGATHFTVLGRDDRVILQRNVIVSAPTQNYMRVRRASCNGDECNKTEVYYCPDMCHGISSALPEEGNNNTSGNAPGGPPPNEQVQPNDNITPQNGGDGE